MGRLIRGCLQSLLKLVNSLIGMVGIAMILYALWMIMDWHRHVDHDHHFPTPFPGHDDPPAPWFMYSFLGLGITLCVITCSGHIAAETANGCCLYCYLVFVFLLFILEAAVTADILLNSDWEQDFPIDPSGDFNKFKDFVRMNFEMCKWIGLSVVCVQGLCMLLAMILKALGPHTERYYDSDDDYIPDRVPLLKNYVHPPAGDSVGISKNEAWNIRIYDKANL